MEIKVEKNEKVTFVPTENLVIMPFKEYEELKSRSASDGEFQKNINLVVSYSVLLAEIRDVHKIGVSISELSLKHGFDIEEGILPGTKIPFMLLVKQK